MPQDGPSVCPTCKKPFRPGTKTCMWCGHDLPEVAEKAKGGASVEPGPAVTGAGKCPTCKRVFQVGAEKCLWCGSSLAGVETEDPEMTCPLCRKPLEKLANQGWIVFMCGECGGAFITLAVLARFEKMYESLPVSSELASKNSGASQSKAGDVMRDVNPDQFYRPCPQCGEQMARRRYQRVSSIVIDECLGHGVWFDPDEFEQAVAFLKQGGLEARKRWDAAHPSVGTGEALQEARKFADAFRGWGQGGFGGFYF